MSKTKSSAKGKKQDKKREVQDDAFKREAVRILAASDRTVVQVADDLGVGRSSLSKWKTQFEREELMAGPHDDVHKEVARLHRENSLLRAERDL